MRLIAGINIIKRSFCPQCYAQIAWYDNIPIISWLLLRGSCRSCSRSISILYPAVEFLTAICFYIAWYTYPSPLFFSYSLFISALIVTIRSDIETGYISRFMSLYLVPCAWLLAYQHALIISWHESIIASIIGYALLWSIGHIYYRLTGIVGMGQGDIDLLALIGAFLGYIGIWITLLVGSIIGSMVGLSLCLTQKKWSIMLPFGPFLALGAFVYLYFYNDFFSLLSAYIFV